MSSKLLLDKPANSVANPFLSQSLLNLSLCLELAQEIHFTALRRAVFQPNTAPAPTGIVSDQFRQQVARWGVELCFSHPAYISEIFAGVTTAVYQAIEQLYCDPLGRSPTMVYHLLTRMAHHAGQPPLHPEAIWAICTYLYQRRQDKTAVIIQPTSQIWHITTLTPSIRLRDHSQHTFQPVIICVLNLSSHQVLAFCITTQEADLDSARRTAIYQAILAERTPGVLLPQGLNWQLPRAVVPDTELTSEIQQQLKRLGIFALRPRQLNTETTVLLYDDWAADLRRYPHLQYHHFVRVFDNFLEKALGYSPQRVVNFLKREYDHLTGFHRDPGSQFPVLRDLLPTIPVHITTDGAIYLDDRRFEHPLLNYWPDSPATVRCSAQDETTIWVYIANHILCEAWQVD